MRLPIPDDLKALLIGAQELSIRHEIEELGRFELGLAELSPIINWIENFLRLPFPFDQTEGWKSKVEGRLAVLKTVYAAVASKFEAWRYHEIQMCLREPQNYSLVQEPIKDLKQLLSELLPASPSDIGLS